MLQSGTGINDNGDIIGFGVVSGKTEGFLLTPLPEPISLALIAIGARHSCYVGNDDKENSIAVATWVNQK